MNFSCNFLLEESIKLQDRLLKLQGLCFSYLFCAIIITSVLHQGPKSLILEVRVAGFHLSLETVCCSRNIHYCPGSIYAWSQTWSLPSVEHA